jgi:XTP/dITP diphosphohydrolase
MHLLIATHNRGKLIEYQEMFADLPFDLVTLDDVGIRDDVAETGATFAENARIKAMAYARQSGLLTLADDSGLQVDVLGGEPGVRSKRYAGANKSDSERIMFLLDKLHNVPASQRTARFHCAIALATPDGNLWETAGACEGEIAFEPRGENGFGYDPIFQVTERSVRMAELATTEKNKVSHRAHAAEKAKRILEKMVVRENAPSKK